MNYNQKFKQLEFNDYYTESDWQLDCQACANLTNPATPDHTCQACADFSPEITTYSYFDIFYLIFKFTIFFVILFLFIKRKK